MRTGGVLLLSAVMAASGCGRSDQQRATGADAADAAATRVTNLADTYVADFLAAFPYQALLLGAPDRHPDQLADHSLPALAKWQQREDEMLAELRTIDVASTEGRPEGITYKFLQNQLETAVGYRVCRMEVWNASPTYTGWQGDLPLAAGQQPVETPAQQNAAFARFSQVSKYLDDEIANLREGLRLGYLAPANNASVVLEQMDAMLKAPVRESPFVQMAKDAGDFRTRLETLETTGIRPAIRRYREFLQATYLPKARAAVSVSANPDGEACYRAAVKYFATVDMTPQEVQHLGLRQMEIIQAQMREVGRRSFGTDDPARLLALVKTDPKYRFSSRTELIKYAEAAVERARRALPKAFGRIPKAPLIVEPYPAFLEKSAPGGQAISPTADGKPGKFMINAYNATEQSKAGLESTAFHEAYPGHHLQLAVALEKEGLHPVSQYFSLSGFSEGWALYTERLAEEMGLFTSDVDRVGLLSNEALRAARLVVDSGMHALGWTRQRAVEYLLAHTAETPARANAEIDRYIAVPGQATAYMIGNLEIRRLRAEAEKTLGARFDLREFHDLVLADGAVPLWVLGEKIQRWIASKQ